MSEFNKEVFLQNLKEVNTVLKQIHICIDNIVKLSNDMGSGDSELQEAITELANNVYSISETDTLLNTKVDKSDIGYLEIENFITNQWINLTNEQYAQCIKKYCIIKANDNIYYKQKYVNGTQGESDEIYFTTLTLNGVLNNVEYWNKYSTASVEANGKRIVFYDEATQSPYTRAAVDGALSLKQDILVSGTNIKTINGASVLGNGDLEVGGGTKYLHHINVIGRQQQFSFDMYLILDTETPLQWITQLFNYVANGEKVLLSGAAKSGDDIQVFLYGVFNVGNINQFVYYYRNMTSDTVYSAYHEGSQFNTYTLVDNVRPF